MGTIVATLEKSKNPSSNPDQATTTVQVNSPAEPTLPSNRSVVQEQGNSTPYRAKLEAESLISAISTFHLAGLQLAVKERYMSQEQANAIKAKVKAGALRSDGVDLILTAAFRNPEQFKKSFGSSAGGNIAAVMRDMDDEISKGLNSHSWSENKYYKPILQELVSIEKNGFMVPEKPKPTTGTVPEKPGEKPDPKSPKTKPETTPDPKNPSAKPHTSPHYHFTTAEVAIKDLGAKLVEISKVTIKPARFTDAMVKNSTQCVKELHRRHPALSEESLFYLGSYRLVLESEGYWKNKAPQEGNELFIKAVTKDEKALNLAISTGRELVLGYEKNFRQIKPEMPGYKSARAAIDIIESVKSGQNQTAPKPSTGANYPFGSASVAMNAFGSSLIAMEKATLGPDLITSETIENIVQCIGELDRKKPELSERDLFYIGLSRMKWELNPALGGKSAKEKNDLFMKHISQSQGVLSAVIQEGRNEASKTKGAMRSVRPGTAMYNDAQKMIGIIDAVEQSGSR